MPCGSPSPPRRRRGNPPWTAPRWSTALAATRTAVAAIGELEAALARHPLRVRLWELLLVAAAVGTGRRAAAQVERRARETFREQLGVEPGERLRALAAAAQRGDLAAAVVAVAPVRAGVPAGRPGRAPGPRCRCR